MGSTRPSHHVEVTEWYNRTIDVGEIKEIKEEVVTYFKVLSL
jgi:hypothetical protein